MLIKQELVQFKFLGHVQPTIALVSMYSSPEGLPVFVISEPDGNPGLSVTNSIDKIYDYIAGKTLHFRVENGAIWIEHYPTRGTINSLEPASFDKVTFPSGKPSWERVESNYVLALIREMPPDPNEIFNNSQLQ